MKLPAPRRIQLTVGLLFAVSFLHAAEPAVPPLVGDDDPIEADETQDPADPKPDPSAEKFWQAMKLLQSKQAGDLAAGRKLLQEASDLEYPHAQVTLAYCHLSGTYGFPKNPRRSVALFRLAAGRGNGFAMSSLGSCYVTGTGVGRDEEKAVEWLQAALSEKADYTQPVPPPDYYKSDAGPAKGGGVAGELANDPEGSSKAAAHFLLAQIDHRHNRPAEAQAHYVAAATAGVDGRAGIYQAAIEAAVNYAFGRGVPRDAAKADEMLDRSRRLAARMGVNLIHNYVELKFVDEFAVADLEEEVEQSGDLQRASAQYSIAAMFADKKSKDYNAAEAARWYQVAADNDQVWAILELALMYANGELGKAEPEKAFALFEKAGGGDKPKHLLGVANLAICLNSGFGTTKDTARAMELFKKYRSRDIACYLGTLGQAPAKPVSFEEEAALTLTWAQQKKDPTAQFILSVNYLSGNGVKADTGEGISWLKKAAAAKQPDALCAIGYVYHFQPGLMGMFNAGNPMQKAVNAYKAAGDAGNVEGLTNYAVCVANGWGVPADRRKAIELYEQCLALDPKHARTHSNLADLYKLKYETAGSRDPEKAKWRDKMLAHYEASAQEPDSVAAIKLGLLYFDGRIITKDLPKAYAYFEQATTVPATRADAHYRLGYMHEFGQTVPVTPSEAAYHYRLAALDGSIPALRRLVNFYISGTGVSLDFDRAMFWLSILASIDYKALVPITDVMLRQQEYKQAVKLLKSMTRADPQIAGHAHHRLYVCYNLGQGVKKNPKAADKHLKAALACENGDALRVLGLNQLGEGKKAEAVVTLTKAARTSSEAAYSLGQMYFTGTDVTANPVQAITLFKSAAKLNHSEAMVFLATLTDKGDQNAPTLNEAIEFAERAENLGNEKAGDLRERLEKRRRETNAQPDEDGRARAL
jgi:TPR repeat protein